ncbi:unnamed protein product [Prorocentrum cordatum]|uniref:Uncharacterized protein n=1 Tax=Prorocentrum cordatum TaxID=2364126 RepID=A0ABN9WFU3_9DINO|nr:unnamed protein product [Polarella glacialis]
MSVQGHCKNALRVPPPPASSTSHLPGPPKENVWPLPKAYSAQGLSSYVQNWIRANVPMPVELDQNGAEAEVLAVNTLAAVDTHGMLLPSSTSILSIQALLAYFVDTPRPWT